MCSSLEGNQLVVMLSSQLVVCRSEGWRGTGNCCVKKICKLKSINKYASKTIKRSFLFSLLNLCEYLVWTCLTFSQSRTVNMSIFSPCCSLDLAVFPCLFYFMVIDHSISNTSAKGWSSFCPLDSVGTFSFNEKRKKKKLCRKRFLFFPSRNHREKVEYLGLVWVFF